LFSFKVRSKVSNDNWGTGNYFRCLWHFKDKNKLLGKNDSNVHWAQTLVRILTQILIVACKSRDISWPICYLDVQLIGMLEKIIHEPVQWF